MIGRSQPASISELRAVLAQVRSLDAPRQARRTTGQLAAVAAFFAILGGSLRAAATHAYLPPTGRHTIEESRMRTLQSLGVVSSIAIASAATAQNAVQWRVEDGGNGHWYALHITGPMTWGDARSLAESLGGYLATPTSDSENALVVSLANDPLAWVVDCCGNAGGPWLGGFQPPGASPTAPWQWVTGEPWSWSGWASGEPNNGFQPGILVTVMLGYPPANSIYRGWADGYATGTSPRDPTQYPLVPSCMIEWSADCNSDGSVDYGQIRSGELADVNANNIPDCCEGAGICLPCRADIDQSGAINGVDLAAILNNWGTSGGKQPRSDVNADGFVDGVDLAEVLNSWGACN